MGCRHERDGNGQPDEGAVLTPDESDRSEDPSEPIAEEDWLEPPLPDTRRGARQLALQALYWERCAAGPAEEAITRLSARHPVSTATVDFARALTAAVRAHTAEIDGLIDSSAAHWRTDRIARLDGILLRLGLAEILYFEDIPTSESIDEAVSLARAYGGEQAYAFVNGVLDSVAKKAAAAKKPAADKETAGVDEAAPATEEGD